MNLLYQLCGVYQWSAHENNYRKYTKYVAILLTPLPLQKSKEEKGHIEVKNVSHWIFGAGMHESVRCMSAVPDRKIQSGRGGARRSKFEKLYQFEVYETKHKCVVCTV